MPGSGGAPPRRSGIPRPVVVEAVHPDDRDRVDETRAHTRQGDAYEADYRIVQPDGTVRWVRDRSFPVRDEAGTVLRYVGIVRDITAARRLEEELRQAQKMEAVGALASGIAHDFRNLLQGIGGFAQVALREPDIGERMQRFLHRIADAALQGATITDRLMAFSHRQDRKARPVVLDKVVVGARPLLARLLGEERETHLRPRGPRRGDPGRPGGDRSGPAQPRHQRPRRHGRGGILTLHTEMVPPPAEGGSARVRLVVADSGAGMDEVTRQRVFEPFFTTKGIGRGTGLGLATVFQTIRHLGGRIDVQSAPGRGTAFTLEIPRCARLPGPEPVGPDESLHLKGRVLLVEDEPMVRLSVRHYMEMLGLEVIEAPSPEAGLALWEAARSQVDAVVTDVMMPGMTGPRMMETLRERGGNVPALYLSAHAREDLLARGVIEADAPMVRKPFDPWTLGRALAGLLPADSPGTAVRVTPRAAVSPTKNLPATILVIEDNAPAREAIASHLHDVGYAVLTAGTSAEAMRIADARTEPVDLLLTDLNLPDAAGDELAARLQQRWRGVPVVLMSGSPSKPAGFHGVLLVKPIELEVLESSIVDEIERARANDWSP